jgi:hypothetical protein
VNVNAATTAVFWFHVVLFLPPREGTLGTDLDNPTRVHRRRRDNIRYFRKNTSPAIFTHGL